MRQKKEMIKIITPVWLITVAAAIPLKPMPPQSPGMPNIKSGFRPIFAKKATINARCIETESPCACKMPLPP